VTYQGRHGDPLTIGADEVLDRYMRLEGLDPLDHDLRSLGGRCDRAFLEAVAAGRPAHPDFADALTAHRTVEACYTSAREQREVAIAEIDA
jgi:myo-inositol 2-dehydrogenase / D-chiro-inositol 1-dehydrogenase